ncbi:MAG: histidine phosphatase family protein, partial [Ruminiclostridium sp.]|nr:histidine phosphatase family protein [Ruminiclostridium sp.]
MKDIITIQHTQSEQHINKMIGSLGDWNLTELGIKQAHSIGKNLADEYKNQKFAI